MLLLRAAWLKEQGKPFTTEASMAERPSSRNCGLKPVVIDSPSILASTDSEA